VATNEFQVLPSLDLTLDQTSLPKNAYTGSEITYATSIQNRGPLEARNVFLSIAVPPEIQWSSVTLDNVPVLLSGPDLSMNLGAVPSGTSVQVAIKLKPKVPGLYSLLCSIRSDGPDRKDVNNLATHHVQVFALPLLNIRTAAHGQIELSWPATEGTFRLESTTDFENWQAVTTAPRLVLGSNIVVLRIDTSAQVFRLRAATR
jgi:uncharacterized repeat protein (TIGR01451 family)